MLNSTFIVSMLSDNSLAKVSMFSCIVLVSGIAMMISWVLMRPNFWAKSDVAPITSTTARVSLIAFRNPHAIF